jgi:peptidoglycan hydrolase-like protein with peptidoglycan-binding domain
VKRLQRLLKDHHFDPGTIDGIFGPATKKAVMKAQKAHGLNPSGRAGTMTWHALIASETKT